MEKFKKGDKIKRILGCGTYGILKGGEIVTFNSYRGTDVIIEEDGGEYYYMAVGFELVSSQEEVLPEEFSVYTNNLDEANKLGIIFKELFKNHKHYCYYNAGSGCYYRVLKDNINCDNNNPHSNNYTFEEFKQLINKNENNNKQTNEVQGITSTNSGAIGSKPVRSNCRNSKITTGARLSSNKVSSKPISSRIKESTTKGSVFKSVYS